MESTAHDKAAQCEADPDAVRAAITQARNLYTAPFHETEVAATTQSLQSHLRAVIPVCDRIAQEMPERSARELTASVATARQLLKDGPADGPMSSLVHMQLLADSASVLYARLRDLS